MKVDPIRALLSCVAFGLLAVGVAGCGELPLLPGSAPTAQPSPTAEPTLEIPTRLPTLAPTAAPTALPTTVPTATRPPSTALRPTATRAPSAAGPTATRSPMAATRPTATRVPASGADPFADVMPDMLSEMFTAMMPSQPVPQGSQVTLSSRELEGPWGGWITFEAVKLEGATPEEQEACESQMAALQGKQLPTDMEFTPRSEGEGMVTIINKQEGEEDNRNDPVPYRYQGGVLTFQVEEDGSLSTFQGRAVRTDSGYAIVGTWKYSGGLEPGRTDTANATVEGTWALNRRLSTSGQDASSSQNTSDLGTRWTGTLTLRTASLQGATPEKQKAFEEQLKEAKDQPQPMNLTFDTRAGTVRPELDSPAEPVRYRYQNGQLSFEFEDEAKWFFEGDLSKTGGMYLLQGTFRATGPEAGGTLTIRGDWSVSR